MHTILFLYTVTPAWLRLSREERRGFQAHTVEPILERYAPAVRAQFCDSEAFTARCSDFAVFETNDLRQFYFLFEELRDTALFTVPYLTVDDLIVGVQDGFREFEATQEARP